MTASMNLQLFDHYPTTCDWLSRAQARNKEICFDKLKEIISECCVEPKERELYEGLSEKGKQRRKLEKRRRGEVKESRRSGRGSFDDW